MNQSLIQKSASVLKDILASYADIAGGLPEGMYANRNIALKASYSAYSLDFISDDMTPEEGGVRACVWLALWFRFTCLYEGNDYGMTSAIYKAGVDVNYDCREAVRVGRVVARIAILAMIGRPTVDVWKARDCGHDDIRLADIGFAFRYSQLYDRTFEGVLVEMSKGDDEFYGPCKLAEAVDIVRTAINSGSTIYNVAINACDADDFVEVANNALEKLREAVATLIQVSDGVPSDKLARLLQTAGELRI